jgi:hypothetical protein
MNDIHIKRAQSWELQYGEYDCEANSVLFCLDQYQIPMEPVFLYNFDFYYDPAEDLIRGCVTLNNLLQFLKHTYGLESITHRFNQIPEGKLVIVPINACFYPLSAEYFQKNRLVHYFPAIMRNQEQFDAYDAIFKIDGYVPVELIHDAWFDLGRDIFSLDMDSRFQVEGTGCCPSLLAEDYALKYRLTAEQINKQLSAFSNDREHIQDNFKFKKYFGNFQSILLSRIKHFEYSSTATDLHSQIINAWRKTIKHFMKISYDYSGGHQQTMASIAYVSELEIAYLERLYKEGYRV